MQLIDSETVKEYLKRVIWGADTKIDTWVEAMPTIDAIPVEWLEAHKTISIEDWGEEPVTVGAALMIWQKEQEAHGT